MKAIILAAGEGQRLRPWTADRPKCMVPYRGRPILSYALEALRVAGVDDVVVVAGYRADAIDAPGARMVLNPRYATTNMVHTLFCAERELEGDVLISYGDIVYGPEIARAAVDSRDPIGVVYDRKWRELWEKRMADPLADAETLRLAPDGRIVELGKKPTGYHQIEGQYMGLIRLDPAGCRDLRRHYGALDREARYEGRPFESMYMTTLLQSLIDAGVPVRGIPVDGGWTEIDSPDDLAVTPVVSE